MKADERREKKKGRGKQNPGSGMGCEDHLLLLGSLQFRLNQGLTPGHAKWPAFKVQHLVVTTRESGSSAGIGLG